MLIDLDHETDSARVDEDGLAALLAAINDPDGAGHPEAVMALASGRIDAALAVMAAPRACLHLAVAGHDTRLEHRIWLADDMLALHLGLRPGEQRLMASGADFLTASLVRLTRIRPRRVGERRPRPFPAERLAELVDTDPERRCAALHDAGAAFAWRLQVAWDDEAREMTAVDGPAGLHLADSGSGTLQPVSNTAAYRVLSVTVAEAAATS